MNIYNVRRIDKISVKLKIKKKFVEVKIKFYAENSEKLLMENIL